MSGPIESLRRRYPAGEASPVKELQQALECANGNAGRNVYLAEDAMRVRFEAGQLKREDIAEKLLWSIPISLKDCFDLEGFPTSCGSRFYEQRNGPAAKDSALAARLRAAGAAIVGKTHMHQLAYGITGESRDYGDCVQPRNAAWLTGGSSSGAAASVQEGSALAAIGTDTGGSIRVPAALCGLAGYRSSLSLQGDLWEGGWHLAPSFDTVGWLYGHLGDGPLLGAALFGLERPAARPAGSVRIGVPHASFLHDCDADVLATFEQGKASFEQVEEFDAGFWDEAPGIYAPIVAYEAAALHRGLFENFEPVIAERLAWGASISGEEIAMVYLRLAEFRERMNGLFERFDYLLLPCCPMSALLAGEDQTRNRQRIIGYTSPISLAGLPAVTLPGEAGGLQLVGPQGSDGALLALSARLQRQIAFGDGERFQTDPYPRG